MPTKNIVPLLLISYLVAGCSTSKFSQSSMIPAVRWTKSSAEYKALCMQTYQTAASQLNDLLQDSSETASLEQLGQAYQNLPPAIILDVDETALNNMAFELKLFRNHQKYSNEKWTHWVKLKKAKAVPGAIKFTQKAASMGVTVFYVTNRSHRLKVATYKNLKKLGFPLKKSTQVILMKGGNPNWNSSKVNRRKYIAQNYRILMLLGDNLNDFLPADTLSHQKRMKLIKKYHSRFGKNWFILPNPVYGSWQQALGIH